jgi:hypothetical protein
MKRLIVVALSVGALTAAVAAAAFGDGGGTARPFASGNQVIQSGPGVYAQTTDEYAASWVWSQQSAPYDYYWYVFQSNGTLVGNGHKPTGGGGSWSGAANIYYFKEYNNEPAGSGHINVLSVDYCC